MALEESGPELPVVRVIALRRDLSSSDSQGRASALLSGASLVPIENSEQ
jgi:hypothetical protein